MIIGGCGRAASPALWPGGEQPALFVFGGRLQPQPAQYGDHLVRFGGGHQHPRCDRAKLELSGIGVGDDRGLLRRIFDPQIAGCAADTDRAVLPGSVVDQVAEWLGNSRAGVAGQPFGDVDAGPACVEAAPQEAGPNRKTAPPPRDS